MTASVTTAPFDLACATALAFTPAGDGYVAVTINGVVYQVGDGTRASELFFSADSGVTARAIADIAIGDFAYIGSGLTFNLDASDVVSFLSVV
jgi:hypothetical protein